MALRGAVVDDGGADGGAVAAVALIDVLDHLLAPFMLEVDVDVRAALSRFAEMKRANRRLLSPMGSTAVMPRQ